MSKTESSKCISLWQPWASLIVIGAKTFETRSWHTAYRGPLLIHAAKKPYAAMQAGSPFANALYGEQRGLTPLDKLPLGCIIGQADVVECYEVSPSDDSPMAAQQSDLDALVSPNGERLRMPRGNELAFGDFTVGRYAWKLANPVRFAKPIPFPGRQQLFNVPREVVADQLATQG